MKKRSFTSILLTAVFLTLLVSGREALSSEWADSVLTALTLEEKVGQLIFPGLRPSNEPIDTDEAAWREAESLIRKYRVGGFVLFGGSFPDVTYRLESLQAASAVPLLITADFERGVGQKIRGMTAFPPNMALGATGSEDLAYRVGLLTALQAVELGIGMTLSPVLDVNSNPSNPIINVRSFGQDPDVVSTLGESYIRGCREGGLLTTAKHFPGHGDTKEDSHTGLPVIDKERAAFEQMELLPFRRAVASGVDAVMVGHLSVPALDSTGTPSSLSDRIVNGILREEMGFQGLVITDALVMDAVGSGRGGTTACRRALSAGNDILLMPESVESCVKSVIQAIRAGEITESDVDNHVKRILEAKERLSGTHGLQRSGTARRSIGEVLFEGENTAQELATRSITLLSNMRKSLPLEADPGHVFAVEMRGDSLLPEASFFHSVMERALGESYEHVSLLPQPDSLTIADLRRKAARADRVMVVAVSQVRAYRGYPGLPSDMISLARDLLQNERSVIVSLGNPYIVADFPDTHGIVLAYGTDRHSQKAAAGAVLGNTRISGKLPVAVPGKFAIGSGIILDSDSRDR